MTHEEIFSYNKFKPTLPLDEPFVFGVNGLAHGHIYGMCQGLINAGATLKAVYEEDEALLSSFVKKYPSVRVCKSYAEILEDPEIALVASAAIPSHRAGIAIEAMKAGKDFFVDKAPVISLEQLCEVRAVSEQTKRKYFVYYSEFVAVEASIFAKQLIDRGVIGEVFHMDIVAPHRLSPETRPEWFFKREDTGGIIIDIGSHQLQQFLAFSGATDAEVKSARVDNYFFKSLSPDGGFDDFGDLAITGNNGVTGYIRIDWNSPKGIATWGDVRAIIQGSDGYIELRKNCDIGKEKVTNTVLVCTEDGVFTESVSGKVGIEYYTNIIKDCKNRTDTAMPVWQTWRAIELAIEAQTLALKAKADKT